MDAMEPGQPFPDEVFYNIFEIEDIVERTQYIEALKAKARMLKRAREFDNIYKAFIMDYIQKMKQTGNETQFTEQPLKLVCGEWNARDTGVTKQKWDQRGIPTRVIASPHPIMPIEILKNVDTNEERITLAFFKCGCWQKITVDRCICANSSKIVDVLSQQGIEVTSENAKYLVRFISDCVGMNPVQLAPKKSINRLGWVGTEFTPYASDIRYEGDPDYEVIFKNIKTAGSFDTWKELCGKWRKNIPLRMMMAASLASALLEPLGVLPFVLHVWGATGTCKTVALMVAMSVWGNPRLGGLVKTMNMTKNAIMRNAAFLCSIPFAGDELQTIKDKWNGNFDQLIYQITEGVDRGRAKAYGGVEETRTWKNSFLLTGEEPITKSNSGGGSKNRVIEIAIDDKLVDDGHYVSTMMAENFGFAGKEFVKYIQNTETKKIVERYKTYFDEICKLDTTDKQAMAMSCVLLADDIATELFFPEDDLLKIADIERYLQGSKEIDVAERAYTAIINWIAKNQVRFEDPKEDNSINKGEVWGKVESGIAIINKDVLVDFLNKNGFDYTAVSKKWAEREQIRRNSQGKYIHSTKVFGIKASYIKITLETDMDNDGFMPIEDEQMELPFN